MLTPNQISGVRHDPARLVRTCICLALLVFNAVGLSRDDGTPRPSPGELSVLKLVVAEFPHVAEDRYQSLNGAYRWKIPSFLACPRHWGLPLSTLNPYTAVYLKALYGNRGSANATIIAAALNQAAQNGTPPNGDSAFFCDPLTWEFWLDPFTKKLTPTGDVGPETASAILRTEILANRTHGYLSAAIRAELGAELVNVERALPEEARERVHGVRIATDVYAPLAAYADRSTMTITLSEGLVRYAFIKAVIDTEGELRDIWRELAMSEDRHAATESLTRLRVRTLNVFRDSLSFTIGHELAHLWVPTIDEREADCNGLAAVIAERGTADIGIFASIKDAVTEGRASYWNGLPAQLIAQRFKLIEVWQRAAQGGADVHAVCVRAWKGLDER